MPGREQTGVALGEAAPLFEVMSTMRAMRRLAPDPVPDELLERLVEAATWAPSGGNAQRLRWLLVTDRSVMAALAEPWRRCVDGYLSSMGGATPDTMDDEGYARLLDALRHQRDHFAQTPAVLLACHPPRGGPRTERLAALSEGASTYPAVQNVLLAARALGLGATLTTWHLWREQEFKDVLGIPDEINTYALIPIGWPLGRFGPVRRRPVSEILHRDRW
jgi:nitroreductase